MLKWATDAVRKSFSLDYVRWREQLQDASNNFTPNGWKWFLSSLKKY
ncbi:DotI/IcmL/TraM family protein [Candidatus Coxiella mudrowiae]|nr:DotI/IcmL/TraM family protein [Candidatus Coxiella mudrowiae]